MSLYTEVLDSLIIPSRSHFPKLSGELSIEELCSIGSSWVEGFLINETWLKKEEDELDFTILGLFE